MCWMVLRAQVTSYQAHAADPSGRPIIQTHCAVTYSPDIDTMPYFPTHSSVVTYHAFLTILSHRPPAPVRWTFQLTVLRFTIWIVDPLRSPIKWKATNDGGQSSHKQAGVDKYTIPRIDEMLDRVRDASYFSKLELHSGFHQIRLHHEHVWQTAFRTTFGTFACSVMILWLCDAQATFQNTIDYIFQNMRQFAGAYINDILLCTKTLAEHVTSLRQVYDKLHVERFFAETGQMLLVTERSGILRSLYCGRLASEPKSRTSWRFPVAPSREYLWDHQLPWTL